MEINHESYGLVQLCNVCHTKAVLIEACNRSFGKLIFSRCGDSGMGKNSVTARYNKFRYGRNAIGD